jgi:hypothetical protein
VQSALELLTDESPCVFEGPDAQGRITPCTKRALWDKGHDLESISGREQQMKGMQQQQGGGGGGGG